MAKCRAKTQSDTATEFCQGHAGHKMHWYKGWSNGTYFIVQWPNLKWRKNVV